MKNWLSPRSTAGIALITIALVALPFVVGMGGQAWVRILNFALLYVFLALGLNIVVGLAGPGQHQRVSVTTGDQHRTLVGGLEHLAAVAGQLGGSDGATSFGSARLASALRADTAWPSALAAEPMRAGRAVSISARVMTQAVPSSSVASMASAA